MGHDPEPTPDDTGRTPGIPVASVVEIGMLVEAVDRVWAIKPEKLAAICARLAAPVGKIELELLADADHEAARGRKAASSAGGVAVIPIQGLIRPGPSLLSLLFGGGGGGLLGFRSQLRDAVDNADVTGIVLDIDSPGGYVDMVPEVAQEIRQARDKKPIAAVANTMAASAAYWLASQAHEVIVTPSGELGSVGVYTMHQDMSRMLAMEGVKLTYIQAGEHKTEGNPYEPLGPEAEASMQQGVDDYYGMFVADVAKGRVFTAKRAVKLGLADRVDTLENTIGRLASGRSSIGRSSSEAPAVEPVVAESFAAEEVVRYLDLKSALHV